MTNRHGWALVLYDYTDPTPNIQPWNEFRGSSPAYSDPGFSQAVSLIRNYRKARILLGHVRTASSGPSNISDPHPFIMTYGGRDFTFMHNGTVNRDAIVDSIAIADSTWLTTHPLQTEIDSEAYFSLIMLNIHKENGDILRGIRKALDVVRQTNDSQNRNFILSDGVDLYGYRKTNDSEHPLAYFYETNEVMRNRIYSGFMSEFPTQDPSSTIPWESGNSVKHQLDDNELVFISSTGNIVRMPNFSTATREVFTHRLAFHEGVNWTGFPILKINPASKLSDFNHFINRGGWHQIDYYDQYVRSIVYDQYNGWIPDITLSQKELYKLHFTSDSPSIHNGSPSFVISNADFIAHNNPVLTNIVANQPYWVSYTLLSSQNIADAFGTAFYDVKEVRGEKWYYHVSPLGQGKAENPVIPDSTYTWSTKNKNMEFGKGYIVTFSRNLNQFTWNRSNAPASSSKGTSGVTCFQWEDAPDYVVVDIIDVDNADSVKEIGVKQNGVCIGAASIDELPCQILAYPDYDNPAPLVIEVVYDSKAPHSHHQNYQLLDEADYSFVTSRIIPEKGGVYFVNLSRTDADNGCKPIARVKNVTNYPNPFNPNTSISFVLSKEAEATVQIYNIKGQKVFDFGSKHYPAGKSTLDWNGIDKSNCSVSSGIYFFRIKTNDDSHTHKMIMMK